MTSSTYVIWLDSQKAKIFKLDVAGVQESELHAHGHKHHEQPHGHHSGGHHPEAEKLFKDLAHALHGATEILLLGPGEAKVHFKTYLGKHDHPLAEKIVGIQTVDHPTANQVLELARKFFKSPLRPE